MFKGAEQRSARQPSFGAETVFVCSVGRNTVVGQPPAQTGVDTTIEDTRRIAHHLSPAFLEKHGLVAAIQSHLDRASTEDGPTIQLDAPQALTLPEAVRNHLYRIFQEALANAISHSGASRIAVTLSSTNRRATLRIHDDGNGGTARSGAEAATAGFGLRAMAQRAELLGGRFEMTSDDSKGTTVMVDVPLRPDEQAGTA